MITTSYFVGAELRSDLLSDIYVKIFSYLKDNNIENIVSFQNPLSLHITFYYFNKEMDMTTREKIKGIIDGINLDFNISTDSYRYFERNNQKKIGYFQGISDIDLAGIRNEFHNHFEMNNVTDNNLDFIPHITFLRILNTSIYENHREDIENIIKEELLILRGKNLFTKNISLYQVNSSFPGQIQIKI